MKALGGVWDPSAYAWRVPVEAERQARDLVPPYPPRARGFGKDTSIAEELHDTYMLYRDEDPDPYE